MTGQVDRRDFLRRLGVGVGTTLGAAAVSVPLIEVARAQEKPKGNIPNTPYRIGHMTFFTGPSALLGEPMYKGQVLAAEEINAAGGLLGKRKIEVLKADEAAGVDGNVKELRRLKLQEKIDFFCGITSSGNSPALGPIAEELKVLTIFVDGCTDFLFDKAVPNPHYIFRITNIQSADGATCALAVAQTWPNVKKIAAEARNERLQFAYHQGDRRQARSAGLIRVGRRLRRDVQASAAVWVVRKDEIRDDPRAGRCAARDRKGSSRRRHRRCPRELPLHVPAGQPLAAEQDVRREVLCALERISELPGRGGVYGNADAEGSYRESQSLSRWMARRRCDHQPARRNGLCGAGGLRVHPPG
ncbi:MAG: twin-arginine translocation signal domain-containing protein [Gammaproteobacteria bacterium]|nr:MAG: twin-arginine translocation signal domain-containing protein [Gammaproteobacteria bacterium]